MVRSPSSAGGVLIAFGAIAGTVIGLVSGQPTLGFLSGIAVGAGIAALLWWKNR